MPCKDGSVEEQLRSALILPALYLDFPLYHVVAHWNPLLPLNTRLYWVESR